MKRVCLKFYGKVIAALLSALVAFTACCTKKSVEKTEKVAENKDTTSNKITVPTYKKGKFPGNEVIAMYGVRPEKLDK